MSYSRWSNSRWYTFWSVQPPGIKETRDNAIFEICGLTRFSAKELRENLDNCINQVKLADCEATIAEIDELKRYIADFLRDVNAAYKASHGLVDT